MGYRYHCNIVEYGCQGRCNTECFRCGEPACRICSKFRSYSWLKKRGKEYVRQKGARRICNNCFAELERDREAHEAKIAARAARQAEIDAFKVKNPDAPKKLRALAADEKHIATLLNIAERRTALLQRKIDRIRNERIMIAYRIGEADEPPMTRERCAS